MTSLNNPHRQKLVHNSATVLRNVHGMQECCCHVHLRRQSVKKNGIIWNIYDILFACPTYISHVNALNAIYRTTANGTLVDALRACATDTHVKAWNDGVVLGIGVANAARIQNEPDWDLIRSLHVATDVYAVEMRTRTPRRLWT